MPTLTIARPSSPAGDIVADATRRQFLAVLGAAGLVAACGGGDDAGSGSTPETPDDETATNDGEGTDERRVIALGEEFLLADLLALGVRPIASTATVAEAGFSGLDGLGLDTDGIVALPATEPNLERLAGFRPDVVVLSSFVIDQIGRDALEGLGELVVIDADEPAERLLALADAFDARPAAEALLGDLDAAIAAARTALDADGRAVSIATVYPGESVAAWVAGPSEVPSTMLALGFTLRPGPDDVVDAQGGRAFLSPEQLGLFDAEVIVALQSELVDGEAEALAAIATDPLWSRLPAVTADRVVTVDRLGYPGIAGRLRLVDDLVELLAR